MRKVIYYPLTLILFCLFTINVSAQNFTIQSLGPTEICGPSQVALEVVSPQPGVIYEWLKHIPALSMGGFGIPIGTGNSVLVDETAYYSCAELTGGSTTGLSNMIGVRVIPHMNMHLDYDQTTVITGCYSLLNMSVPLLYLGGNDQVKWYKNNVLIPGANTGYYTAITSGYYKYSITNNSCPTTIEVFSDSVLVNITPATCTPSGYQLLCNGNSMVLTANTVSGVSYQWEKNGVAIPGATSTTYTANSAGGYVVKMTYSPTCTVSAGVSIVVMQPGVPVISFPTAATIMLCNGSTYNMSTPFEQNTTFQWFKNGVALAGQTNNSLTVSQAGSYTVSKTNVCGTFVSAAKTVLMPVVATITPAGPTTVCSGNVVLNANVGGAGYFWKLNGNFINGATTASYTATASGSYSVQVNGYGCNAISSATVVAIGGLTAAVTPAGTTTFCAGSITTLTANAGTGITYQWYRNIAAISGATLSTYAASSAGTFYVVENSTCGTATSNSVVVSQINNPTPSISYSTPLSFCSSGSVLLTSSTFSGVTYQLQKNGTDIAGATSQTYAASTNGTYKVKQTANGCYKSSPGVSTTTATSVVAAITANGPVTFCNGGSVVLSVTGAVPGYSYQWKNNNSNIAGATTSSYTATSAGVFTCLVTASCGSVTSNAITVSTGGITASVSPAGTINICNGATAALNANIGSGYTFQWKKNGTNISGATSSTYNATTAGAYTVAITSPCGNATSAATTVAITAVTATVTPAGTSVICAGLNITYSANTGYNYAYQWRKNGVNLTGATLATYKASSNGNYSVIITQGGICSATSANATLTVTNNPTPTITAGGSTIFCAGQSVTLTANTFAGVTYQWEKSGNDIAGATAQSYIATAAGLYKVRQTANGCTKSSSGITVVVNCRVAGVGISDDAGSDEMIKVFPNPFTEEVTVYVGSASSPQGLGFATGDRIELVDVVGKSVMKVVVNASTKNLKLQTSNIPSGIYFLQINNGYRNKTIKVVKL